MKRRVLVASNRGPVSYQFGPDGSLTARRGGGGMIAGVISGLAAVAPEAEVTWICAALSEADRMAARQHRLAGPQSPQRPQNPHDQDSWDLGGAEVSVPVRMLDIPPDTFNRAYNNVANSTLWFLPLLLFDTRAQPQFGRQFQRDWTAYLAYNEAFADALAAEAGSGEA